MANKQKTQGFFTTTTKTGSNYLEEMGTELGLTEQGKASKANRTTTTTTTKKQS